MLRSITVPSPAVNHFQRNSDQEKKDGVDQAVFDAFVDVGISDEPPDEGLLFGVEDEI